MDLQLLRKRIEDLKSGIKTLAGGYKNMMTEDWKSAGREAREIKREPSFNFPTTPITADQQRNVHRAVKVKREQPDWYRENIGFSGEKAMLGSQFGVPKYADMEGQIEAYRQYLKRIGQEPQESSRQAVAGISYPSQAVIGDDYQSRPYAKEIQEIWGEDAATAHGILYYVDEDGVIRGENTNYQAGPEVDIPNRINPQTGKYDPNSPITMIKNSITDEIEQSIDRGLFRINNQTFYLMLGGKKERQMMYERGIIPEPHEGRSGLTPQKVKEYWDLMLDPVKNIKFAKLLYELKPQSWYAASPTSGARLE